MAIGRELKDFLAAYTAMNQQNEKRRWNNVMERYYKALENHYKRMDSKGKDDPLGDAYNAGRSRAGGGPGAGSMPVTQVYDAAREAGFSDNQSRALVAEAGRENGLNPGLIYGSHKDPANNATNIGVLSYQGDRAVALKKYLGDKGMLDENGNIKQTPEALTEQFRFARNEMATNPAYAETKKQFLENPNIDPEAASKVLGQNYIRWRYDDPKYASHHETRRNFLGQIDKDLPRAEPGSAGEILNARTPRALPKGKANDLGTLRGNDQVGDAGENTALPDMPSNQMAFNDAGSDFDYGTDYSGADYTGGALDEALPLGSTQIGAAGGMIRPVGSYEDGGLVEDDDEEDTDKTQGQTRLQPPSGAIPVAPGGLARAAAPAAQSEDVMPEKDGLLGVALHGGISFLQKLFGVESAHAGEAKPGQSDKAALPQPEQAQKTRLFMSGMGAMSPQEYDEVMKSVDPNGQMDESLRHISGLKGVFDYHMKRGDMPAASKAAAAMIQASRLAAAQYGDAAEAAIKSGDFSRGAALLKKAYAQVPDGNKVDAEVGRDGNGVMTITDQSGKTLSRTPFTPEAMLNAALGMKSGQLYWQALVQAAGNNLGQNPSAAYKQAVRGIYGIDPDAPAAGGGETPPAPPPAPPGPTAGAKPEADGGAGSDTEAVPSQPGQQAKKEDEDGFAVPNRIGPASAETPIPQQRPALPPEIKPIQPDRRLMGAMTDDERTSYMAEIKKVNDARAKENQAARSAYAQQVKEYEAALKGAGSKASDPGFDGAAKLNDGIKEVMPTYIAGSFVDPKTGKPFGEGVDDPNSDKAKTAAKDAEKFIGVGNRRIIGNIANDIAMRNAGARSADMSVALATSLVQPDTDNKNKPNFRPLHYTPDGSVVLLASDGRKVVVGADTYAQIKGVTQDLHKRYVDGLAAAKKDKETPGMAMQGLQAIGEGFRGLSNRANRATPNPMGPEPPRASPQNDPRGRYGMAPSTFDPRSQGVDARDLLGPKYGTGRSALPVD